MAPSITNATFEHGFRHVLLMIQVSEAECKFAGSLNLSRYIQVAGDLLTSHYLQGELAPMLYVSRKSNVTNLIILS